MTRVRKDLLMPNDSHTSEFYDSVRCRGKMEIEKSEQNEGQGYQNGDGRESRTSREENNQRLFVFWNVPIICIFLLFGA